MRNRLLCLLTGLAVLGCLNAAVASAAVPPDFEDTLVTKVSGPTAIAFTPDRRLLITSHFGELRVYKNGALLPDPAIDLGAKICSDKERGLLGVAVDPAYSDPANHYIYLYYTFNKFNSCAYSSSTSPVNRVSRFKLSDASVVDPASEQVLIDNVPSPDGIHNAGDLQFGKDGNLYVSIGDGGCDYQGNSGCGSQNDASRDPHVLLGKILRITPNGGIPATNPFQGSDSARCNLAGRTSAGKKCQETFASGLRNPFRIAFDPNATGTRFFVNDVGQATWEEIDLGQPGVDYGWNVREGHCARGSSTDCGPPPSGMTNPIYDYNHDTGCTAVTGGAFVPNGIWPSQYNGAYLYADFTCGKIFSLKSGGGGGFTATEFVTGLGDLSAVVMAFGPHGSGQALYYTTYNLGGQIRRVAYTGSLNRAPVAKAVATSPPYGDLPLNVAFDGTGSSDPDGDPLTYEWDFGDGTPRATAATTNHTYTQAGTYTATLRVRDDEMAVGTARIRIDAGNNPPSPTIQLPAWGARFRVGETITLQGSATDQEDGPLPDSALSWRVLRKHDSHFHPFLDPRSGNGITFTAPAPEDLAAATTSDLRIRLTATDSKGLKRTVIRILRPKMVDVTFRTEPDGLDIEVNGSTITGPTTLASWEAYALQVNARAQVDGSGQDWTFSSWSDGGAAAHTITTPPSAATYTATFRPVTVRTFAPTADARVEEATPSTNFGTSTKLRADGGVDPDVESFLRFSVANLSGPIQRARLRLYVPGTTDSGTVDGPAVYATNTSWSETGIVWTNRPARTSSATDDKGAIAADSWVEYDVKPLLGGNGTWSFVLATGSNDGVNFDSRQASDPLRRPKLVVTSSP
jgi:glucose/arabinose dehydrogenase